MKKWQYLCAALLLPLGALALHLWWQWSWLLAASKLLLMVLTYPAGALGEMLQLPLQLKGITTGEDALAITTLLALPLGYLQWYVLLPWWFQSYGQMRKTGSVAPAHANWTLAMRWTAGAFGCLGAGWFLGAQLMLDGSSVGLSVLNESSQHVVELQLELQSENERTVTQFGVLNAGSSLTRRAYLGDHGQYTVTAVMLDGRVWRREGSAVKAGQNLQGVISDDGIAVQATQ